MAVHYLQVNVYPSGDRWRFAVMVKQAGGKNHRLIRNLWDEDLDTPPGDLQQAALAAAEALRKVAEDL